MSRNATASWSGYSHQGKIGLLIALIKLNNLHGINSVLTDFCLSYETQEDVSLLENGNAIEVHQVKAYTSGTTIGSYTAALLVFEDCAGGNYLHSICEIVNWGVLSVAQNPQGVVRFQYSNGRNYCPLNDINDVIDAAIFSLLTNLGHPQRNNEAWRLETYYSFLGVLDDKIRIEHDTKAQADYDITFSLQEVYDIIVSRTVQRNRNLNSIKEKMYSAYLEFILDLENQNIVITQDQEIIISNCIKNIYGLPDAEFEQFLRDINPHTTEGLKFETCVTTDEYFSKENFQAVFIECIRQINNSTIQVLRKKPPHFFKGKYYLLTSINSPSAHLCKCARQILKNDKTNFSSYETDFIINENHTGELGLIASTLNDYDPAKFHEKKKMTFIKKDDVIPILNA
jgi:hypothetical protein